MAKGEWILMNISDVIMVLEKLRSEVGDVEVSVSSGDYPGLVDGAHFVTKGDGYIPTGNVVITGGI
jgi:hypothetical protein